MQAEKAKCLVEFMQGYNEHFDELKVFIAKKQERVIADDLIWLTDSLPEEQRLVMRGNSLEAKRILLLDELGFRDYKSDQLLDEMPDDYKGQFRLLLDYMDKSVKYIKETNTATLDIIEKKLSVQAALLNQSIIAGSDTYNAKGAKIHKSITNMEDDFIGKV